MKERGGLIGCAEASLNLPQEPYGYSHKDDKYHTQYNQDGNATHHLVRHRHGKFPLARMSG